MKKAAALLFALAVIALGITLWGYAGARLELRVEQARALPEAEFAPRFERLREQLLNGGVRGVAYRDSLEGGREDYQIIEYTIFVGNRGLIRAEMLEAVVVPLAGDILCFPQQEMDGMDFNASIGVDALRQTRLRCYLLTRKDRLNVTDIQVSYYVWGNPFILKVQYG